MRSILNKLAATTLIMALVVPFGSAQSTAETPATKTKTKTKTSSKTTTKHAAAPAVTAEDIKSLRDALTAQQQQIEQLRNELARRDEVQRSNEAAARSAQEAAQQAASKAEAAQSEASTNAASLSKVSGDVADLKTNVNNVALNGQESDKRIASAEGILGRFRLSGDVRVRGESFHMNDFQVAAVPATVPATLVNCSVRGLCVPDRNRARFRVRFGVDGKLNEDFVGGFYLATGTDVNGAPSFTDPVSTNETFTSFFERKTIGIDRAWITYQPLAHKWLSLTGGKFAYPWIRTPMTFDNDLNPEGFDEKLSFDIKNPIVKNLTVQGLQLFYNEISGAAADSNAIGGSISSRLQVGNRITITPSYTALNWNGSNAIAQAAFPVSPLPQPATPAVGAPLPQPTTQPIRTINANAFTNASVILGTGTGQTRGFLSDFLYSDFILDTNVKTPWAKFPWRILGEYEDNLRARNTQSKAYWLETSLGQQKERNNILVGYSFARIEQDAVISQFNESDMVAPTNVVQHRFYFNWLLRQNTTAAFTYWLGRTLNRNLQNAALPANLAAGQQSPFLNRLQLDLIYKF